MLLAEFIAGAVMLTATALSALDTKPGRAVLYAIARHRRRQRAAAARSITRVLSPRMAPHI
jgi:hypothetical protein